MVTASLSLSNQYWSIWRGGCYVGLILPGSLADFFAERREAVVEAAVEGLEAAAAEAAEIPSPRWEPMGGAQGCEYGTMRTCPYCTFSMGRTCRPSWWVLSYPPVWLRYLQELALVRGILVEIRA